MKIYIAKPNTWFKEGELVKLLEYLTVDKDGIKYGVFEGRHELSNGDLRIESEVCSYEDFDIHESPYSTFI